MEALAGIAVGASVFSLLIAVYCVFRRTTHTRSLPKPQIASQIRNNTRQEDSDHEAALQATTSSHCVANFVNEKFAYTLRGK